MIPSTTGYLEEDFEIEEEPTLTYCMDIQNNRIRGYTDEQEAMKQAIFKILSTERYAYIMYSWDYGIETMDLYGEPLSYVCPELERRITEALMYDTRIIDVTDFEFDISKKKSVHVSFIVHTVFGDITAEKEVNI